MCNLIGHRSNRPRTPGKQSFPHKGKAALHNDEAAFSFTDDYSTFSAGSSPSSSAGNFIQAFFFSANSLSRVMLSAMLLALQLQLPFQVGLFSFGLVAAAPDGPS